MVRVRVRVGVRVRVSLTLVSIKYAMSAMVWMVLPRPWLG